MDVNQRERYIHIVIVCLLYASSYFVSNTHKYLTQMKKWMSEWENVWRKHDFHLFLLSFQYYAHDSTLNDSASSWVCIMDWKSEMNTTEKVIFWIFKNCTVEQLHCVPYFCIVHKSNRANSQPYNLLSGSQNSPYHEWSVCLYVHMCVFVHANGSSESQNNSTWKLDSIPWSFQEFPVMFLGKLQYKHTILSSQSHQQWWQQKWWLPVRKTGSVTDTKLNCITNLEVYG